MTSFFVTSTTSKRCERWLIQYPLDDQPLWKRTSAVLLRLQLWMWICYWYGNLTWMTPSWDDSQFFSNIHIKASPKNAHTKIIKHAETGVCYIFIQPNSRVLIGSSNREFSVGLQLILQLRMFFPPLINLMVSRYCWWFRNPKTTTLGWC